MGQVWVITPDPSGAIPQEITECSPGSNSRSFGPLEEAEEMLAVAPAMAMLSAIQTSKRLIAVAHHSTVLCSTAWLPCADSCMCVFRSLYPIEFNSVTFKRLRYLKLDSKPI